MGRDILYGIFVLWIILLRLSGSRIKEYGENTRKKGARCEADTHHREEKGCVANVYVYILQCVLFVYADLWIFRP